MSDDMTPITRESLVKQLRSLGVFVGSTVMVHASLRRVGPIDGGATALIEALSESIGPEGTLVMVLGSPDGQVFHPKTTPVDTDEMGFLAEVFRRHPGVEVNDHAGSRFAALGPCAKVLLEPTPLHDSYGPGSVLERLVARDGVVLRLGSDIDTVTLTHHAEYFARVPNKKRVRRRVIRHDVGEQWIESLDDTDGITTWKGGDYFSQIFLDYRALGEVKLGPVGHCTAELLQGQPFVQFAIDWMNRNLA